MADKHPIEGIMYTALQGLKDMIDVNTIIGEPIETSNNIVIIPISKVCFGFAAGGSEFKGETIDEYTKKDKDEKVQYRLPFGGGSGATVSINPIAFLIVEEGKVRLLPVNHSSCIDKILDYVPDLFEKLNKSNFKSELKNKKEQDEKNNIEIKKEHVNNKKAHINKVPKTTEEKFEYIPKKIKQEENKEIADEMEDLFDDEFEYDDD